MTPPKKIITNAFILIMLFLTLVDICPTMNRFHGQLKDTIDPLLDITGLWQGPWELFSPEPDKVNVRLSARLYLNDGTTLLWKSPDWYDTSPWTKFTHFRYMEYIDSIRMNENRKAWPALANYLSYRHRPSSGATVSSVVLSRHWYSIKPPSEQWLSYGSHSGHPESSDFFTWAAKP